MDYEYFKKEFLYPCDNQISCYPIEVVLSAGAYRIEYYGASGGTSGNGIGGYGAYVSGYILLKSVKRVFLFIGAQGHKTVGQPSFNGGGRGHLNPSYESLGASGGGSTDVRLKNSTKLEGLVSRIIVAAAGGGGESYRYGASGGNAGIFTGEDGKAARHQGSTSSITYSGGANVSSGGNGGRCEYDYSSNTCHNFYHGHGGGFGFGGGGSNHSYGGGGGSGYFGGGGGAVASGLVGSGAGGSSYVSGYKGFHTFEIENGELKDTKSEKHYSGLIFYDVDLKSGNETNYVGNGKVVITRIMLIIDSCKIQLNDYYCFIVYASFMVLFS
jgi:hypothetical protein